MNDKKTEYRYREIIRYNIIGIVMNIFLSIGKITIGILTHAHAVILDGIEGLSDLVSSIFSIFSAKIGAKKADKNHPFGYGRSEYLISLLVTIIIMFFGVRSIVESIQVIIDPHDAPDYNPAVIIIMIISLVLKFFYGVQLRKKGREINSVGMIMSGNDALGDALTSAAILAAVIINNIFGIDIEHYLCIGISVLIIITGWNMMRECVTKLIGTNVDPVFSKNIRSMIIMEDGVLNVSNLVIHNYGEGIQVGSVEIEVDENMRASEISRISRNLIRKSEELGLILTSVGISAANVDSPEAAEMWDQILEVIMHHKDIKKAHSFEVDFEKKLISFSIVPDYNAPDREGSRELLFEELRHLFPDMTIEINEGRES